MRIDLKTNHVCRIAQEPESCILLPPMWGAEMVLVGMSLCVAGIGWFARFSDFQ